MVFQYNQIDDELNFHILSLQAPPLHYHQRHLIILNWSSCQNLNQYNLRNCIDKIIFQDKENLFHSKPFIKMIDILMLIVSLVESTDQTIIQIIRENKSVLMLLINPSNCFTVTYVSKTIATTKMKVSVV